jgi:hypothetical protein
MKTGQEIITTYYDQFNDAGLIKKDIKYRDIVSMIDEAIKEAYEEGYSEGKDNINLFFLDQD